MYLKFILLLLIYILFPGCYADHNPSSKSTNPNVLVLIADDAGWQDFGCYGNPHIRTPNIDALASDGFKAENAFLTAPQCSPSRISVLTGKYPHQTGAEDLHMPLPESETLIPTYLKKTGYFTGYLRKAHLGPKGEKQFDWQSNDLDDFAKFLDLSNSKPFFMWVGFTDPHRPYEKGIIDRPHNPDKVIVPPYLVDDTNTRIDLADYYNEITRMDTQIGSYLQLLQNRGIIDNTLIIFFSDNGAPFPRAKGTLYDSGIKTPLIFHWPSSIEQGIVYPQLMSVIDLAPTILDAGGVEIPQIMEGKSILQILSDPTLAGRNHVYSERNWHNCDEHMRSIRSERFKFISNAYTDLPHGTPSDLGASLSWKSLKTLHDLDNLTPIQAMLFTVPRPAEELYDIKNDPYESKNLISDPVYQEIAAELRQNLELWRKQTNDFSPNERRRQDNVDRFTGVKFDQTKLPPRLEEK